MAWDKRKSFYVLLVGLGLLTLYILWGYLGLLFLALILVIVFEPVYEWLFLKTKRPGWAAVITTLTVLLVMILPLALLISMAANQAAEAVSALSHEIVTRDWSQSQALTLLNTYIPGSVGQVENFIATQQSQFVEIARSAASGLGQVVTKGIVPAVTTGAKAIIDVVIFVMVLSYLFPVKKKMFAQLKKLSPLEEEKHDLFVHRFEVVIRQTIKSTLLIGLTQGILGAIMLGVLGVKTAALWGLLMVVMAFVPFGVGLVCWPIAIAFVVGGMYVQAIIWSIYVLVVVLSVDNVVRPKVMRGGEAALPEIVTFISVLGGLQVFGFLGFIIGPLIAAMFLTAVGFYLEDKEARE